MNKYIDALVNHRWILLLFSLLLIVTCGLGLRYLSVESDYEIFFDGENEGLKAHRALEDQYGRKDAVRIGIKPKEADVFDPAVLSIIEELTKACWEIPYSNRVESLTNFPYTRSVDGDIDTGDLFESPSRLSHDEIEKRKAFALSDPSVVNMTVNPQGTVAGLQVIITLPEDDPRVTTKITDYTRDLLNEFSVKYPNIDFYLTGSIVTNDAFFKASTLDTARLIGFMLIIGLLFLAVLLRSAYVILITLSLIIGSTIVGLGLASWLGLPFTVFSSSALIIIIAVIIASNVHILDSLLTAMRRGQTKNDALKVALRSNIRPVFLTTITTAVGFFCLNFSDIPPSRYLGTTSALSVLGGLVLNFTLLPALVSLLPIKVTIRKTKDRDDYWARLSVFILRNKLSIVLSVTLFSLFALIFITRNEINDSVLTYFDKSVPFRSDSDFLMENLFYFYSMDLSIPSGEENGVNDPYYMQKVDELVSWANKQPEVYTVLSFTNILKNLNRAIHQGNEHWYKLPEQKSVAAEYMLLYEMSVPFGLDLNNQISIDKSAAKIIIGFHDIKGDGLIAFDQRIKSWIENNFEPHMRSIPAGPSLMFANIWGDAAQSNLLGMAVAVILISLIIAIAMRSVALGFLCLIPNSLPVLIAFGLWGLVVGRIDMGASVVAVIAFGIVVDDSIHFIDKFRYAIQRLRYSAEDSIKHAMASAGHAITISSVVLVFGFSVLAQSHFALNSKVGILTCIILVLALFIDLFLLPILLVTLYKNRTYQGSKLVLGKENNENVKRCLMETDV